MLLYILVFYMYITVTYMLEITILKCCHNLSLKIVEDFCKHFVRC